MQRVHAGPALKKAQKALFLKLNYSAKDFWKEIECLIEQRMCLLYDTLGKNNAELEW